MHAILITWLLVLTIAQIVQEVSWRKRCQFYTSNFQDNIKMRNGKLNNVKRDLDTLRQLTEKLSKPVSETGIFDLIEEKKHG